MPDQSLKLIVHSYIFCDEGSSSECPASWKPQPQTFFQERILTCLDFITKWTAAPILRKCIFQASGGLFGPRDPNCHQIVRLENQDQLPPAGQPPNMVRVGGQDQLPLVGQFAMVGVQEATKNPREAPNDPGLKDPREESCTG